jgi:methionine synthase I (cobalamin-dependent)
MHEEFVHAGSDVVEAFTYYGHREKLRLIGRENDLELMNRKALQIARQVANETNTLMAGNICNTTRYDVDDPKSHEAVKQMFKESITWAVEEGADFIIAETFPDFAEALLALECIKEFAPGKESVIMLAQHRFNSREDYGTRDGLSFPEACKRLFAAGATVAGLNCSCGPQVMTDMMRDIRKACPNNYLAALPVPYRTTWEEPQMQNLIVEKTGKRAFPYSLDSYLCPMDDIVDFANVCKELNIQYCGLCCGNTGKYTRTFVETLGRKPPASRFRPNMDLHYIFGTSDKLHKCNTEKLKGMVDAKNKPADQHIKK